MQSRANYYHIPRLFTIHITPGQKRTDMVMKCFTSYVTTHDLLHLESLLKKYLPSIYYSECFNKDNKPFSKEMLTTELGHLYEHILIEYISKLRYHLTAQDIPVEGFTKWNWSEDEYGTFHITVSVGENDSELLRMAMDLTNRLFTEILTTHTQTIN